MSNEGVELPQSRRSADKAPSIGDRNRMIRLSRALDGLAEKVEAAVDAARAETPGSAELLEAIRLRFHPSLEDIARTRQLAFERARLMRSSAAGPALETLASSLHRLEQALSTEVAYPWPRATGNVVRLEPRAADLRLADRLHATARLLLKQAASVIVSGLAVTAMSLAISGVALAAPPPPPPPPPIPVLHIGDTILNPVTGKDETVTALIGNYAVITNDNNTILLATAVGQSFVGVEPGGTALDTYTITGVTKNAAGEVVKIKVSDSLHTSPPPPPERVVTNESGSITGAKGPGGTATGGTGSKPISFPTATSDKNYFIDSQRGNDGSGGSAGVGVRICFPFVGCATIGTNPTAGGPGSNGPDINDTIAASHPAIQTVTAGLAGITLSSVGGNGGGGGNGYLDVDGAAGGAPALAAASPASTTPPSPPRAKARTAFSPRAGAASGGLAVRGMASAAAGRAASRKASAVRSPSPTTAPSTRAAWVPTASSRRASVDSAGPGGSSIGIVGQAGDGSVGGQGGDVFVYNSGVIQTVKSGAAGIFAESIGGSGGSSGTGAGLVTFASNGGSGGNGGDVSVTNYATGTIVTEGVGAVGIYAQSVGGGGGNGGVSGGLVAFGSAGAGGGDGHTVTVENDGSVTTEGADSRGIFAQSIGGGGGSADGSGGLVSLGGSGAGGGNGELVTVTQTSTGSVTTTGIGSDGIFAQSVGGGGGAGSGSGGVVALGGKGGGGGQGGAVVVNNAGQIETSGDVSHGIFAQSVGGGGGDGGNSGGLVSIGGSGSTASVGGDVSVTNTGFISTKGLDLGGHLRPVGRRRRRQWRLIGRLGIDRRQGRRRRRFRSSSRSARSVSWRRPATVRTASSPSRSAAAAAMAAARSARRRSGCRRRQAGGGGGGGADRQRRSSVGFSAATVTTAGQQSNGLFAQSVGGGGGNGGYAATGGIVVSAAFGGEPRTAAAGGLVCVNTDASCIAPLATLPALNIQTTGDRSNGIFAQSVGGGGGNGGFAISGAVGIGGAASMSFGGKGGAGGSGGDVLVGASGQIVTDGLQSNGIEATSVGGGGGNGGFAVAAAGSFGGAAALTFGGLARGGQHRRRRHRRQRRQHLHQRRRVATVSSRSPSAAAAAMAASRRPRPAALARSAPRSAAPAARAATAALSRHLGRGDLHHRRPFGRHPGAKSIGGGGGNGGFAVAAVRRRRSAPARSASAARAASAATPAR